MNKKNDFLQNLLKFNLLYIILLDKLNLQIFQIFLNEMYYIIPLILA